QGYFAEPNVKFGIEIDVAAFEELGAAPPTAGWTPAAPVQTVPFTIVSDIVEVAVFGSEGGPTLAGAIELVSPANKDRPSHRDAFVAKCQSDNQQGIGLAIADVVTERHANLHEELLARLNATGRVPLAADLYATSYHPVTREGETKLDIWQEALAIGNPLP